MDCLVDLVVLHAYQSYVASAGLGKPAGDAEALDAVLSRFLELLPGLHDGSRRITWDVHYTQHTAEQVIITQPLSHSQAARE